MLNYFKKTPFLLSLLVFLFGYILIQMFIYIKHDFVLQAFYGDGNYSRVPVNFHPTGNMVNYLVVKELRADNTLSCQHIEQVDGSRPVMSFPDKGAPVCCWLGDKQSLVPYKIIENKLHLLCGEWPNNEEVILNSIPDLLRQK